MEKLKLYTVTKTSSDETLQIGDIIWLSENKDLNNANKGFLSKHEWEVAGTNDFGVEECKTYHLLVINGCEMVVKNKSCLQDSKSDTIMEYRFYLCRLIH